MYPDTSTNSLTTGCDSRSASTRPASSPWGPSGHGCPCAGDGVDGCGTRRRREPRSAVDQRLPAQRGTGRPVDRRRRRRLCCRWCGDGARPRWCSPRSSSHSASGSPSSPSTGPLSVIGVPRRSTASGRQRRPAARSRARSLPLLIADAVEAFGAWLFVDHRSERRRSSLPARARTSRSSPGSSR